MPNKPRPDLIGLTDREKQAVHSREWQEANRMEYRKYQAEYHRMYNKDPKKVIGKLARKRDELQSVADRINIRYQAMLAPYTAKLEALSELIAEQQHLIDTNAYKVAPRK